MSVPSTEVKVIERKRKKYLEEMTPIQMAFIEASGSRRKSSKSEVKVSKFGNEHSITYVLFPLNAQIGIPYFLTYLSTKMI